MKQVWTDWVNLSEQKYSKILSEVNTSNPSGQNYSKILFEVKTSNPSGQKYFKILSEVKADMKKFSKPFWTKIF